MAEIPATWLRVVVRFPLGAYHAQSGRSFDDPEWPPHPVRLVAALVAAADALPSEQREATKRALDRISASHASPLITAPRLGDADADGVQCVAPFRGASRWAPRNHQLSELSKGVHPRELGRERAEISKVAVSIGDSPIAFNWSLTLPSDEEFALRAAAGEVTWLGTSRSPVVVTVMLTDVPPPAEDTWAPVDTAESTDDAADVRVPVATLPDTLKRWHEQRSGPIGRNGSPARAGFVAPASLGRVVRYAHGGAVARRERAEAFDPEWWGDMLVLAVDPMSRIRPKAPASFAVTRSLRAALLASFAPTGGDGDAPCVLHGREERPHAAFFALLRVGDPRAAGEIGGVAILLPHPKRLPSVSLDRTHVEKAVRRFVSGSTESRPEVGVPGVGDILFGRPRWRPLPSLTLQEQRWRRASATWASVTPVVHSRYRRNQRAESLLQQLTADCADVGLPEPVSVEVLKRSPFTGAPYRIGRRDLPERWLGPLQGPSDHVRLTFERPVVGPILLGRARHFGLGLCLPEATPPR